MSFRTWAEQVALQDLPRERRWSYLCFALALFLALGSYQFIVPVKTALFFSLVGSEKEPVAKSFVLLALVPMLFCYGLLISYVRNPKFLVFWACGFYGVVYIFIAVILLIDAGHPRAWIAWVLYYATETRGVMLMPMIWSVVNDKSTPEYAKKAFPSIFFVIQVGGIVGSFIAVKVNSLGGEVGLVIIQVAILFLISVLCWAGCHLVDDDGEGLPLIHRDDGQEGNNGSDTRHLPDTRGCFQVCAAQFYNGMEGLWLLLSRPYVFLTFWVSYATLMPRTILDYQNSLLVIAAHPDRHEQIAFFGNMGIVQNACVALLTLLGTRFVVEGLGLGLSLLVLPSTMLVCVLLICTYHGLWTSVSVLIVACVVAYGLNSPCKEILYVHTSRDIKYKAKSWSEMFGNEVMKVAGAQINLHVNLQTDKCLPHCFRPGITAGIAIGWVVVWAGAAATIWRLHAALEREGKQVT